MHLLRFRWCGGGGDCGRSSRRLRDHRVFSPRAFDRTYFDGNLRRESCGEENNNFLACPHERSLLARLTSEWVPRREGEEAESAVVADANNASGEAVESFVRPSSNFLCVCFLIATVDSKLSVSLEGRSHTQIGCDLLETLLRKLELIEIFRMSIHLRCISKYLWKTCVVQLGHLA